MSAGRANKYHPVQAVLHWTLAWFIIASLAFGAFVLVNVPNADPRKLDMLQWHMGLGMAIFAAMLVRLLVRWRTARPAPASSRAAGWAHLAFYVLVFGMAISGYATALIARLNEIVFARSGAPLPASFEAFPTFHVHAWIALVLSILIGLHVLAALWHWLARHDGVMRRMGFGGRRVE